jgi:hypothetical protein
MTNSQETGAILTPNQREFLRIGGCEDLSDASIRMKRRRIANRIQLAITEDIPLITEAIAMDNAPKSLSTDKIAEGVNEDEFQQNLSLLVSLVEHLSNEIGLDGEEIVNDGLNEKLETRGEKLLKKFNNDPDSMTLGELSDLSEISQSDENNTRSMHINELKEIQECLVDIIKENHGEEELIVSPDNAPEKSKSDEQ